MSYKWDEIWTLTDLVFLPDYCSVLNKSDLNKAKDIRFTLACASTKLKYQLVPLSFSSQSNFWTKTKRRALLKSRGIFWKREWLFCGPFPGTASRCWGPPRSILTSSYALNKCSNRRNLTAFFLNIFRWSFPEKFDKEKIKMFQDQRKAQFFLAFSHKISKFSCQLKEFFLIPRDFALNSRLREIQLPTLLPNGWKKTFEISVPWELTIVLFGQIFDYFEWPQCSFPGPLSPALRQRRVSYRPI